MGICGETSELKIAVAGLHFGEEPPITGNGGSGTIFISGCNLRCVFCQNYQIAHNGMGKIVDTNEFVQICLSLQKAGAENINIVTGSHAVYAIADGIRAAKKAGLSLPCLWNSSAYEKEDAIKTISEWTDMYLPDLKTLNKNTAHDFFGLPFAAEREQLSAADYPVVAQKAILKMIETKSPVIIRHLVLPNFLHDTKEVLHWIADNAQKNVSLSLMTQYTPVRNSDKPDSSNIPNRFLDEDEYKTVMEWVDYYGIDGYYQELNTGSDWLPDFNKKNPFSSELSKILWHWKFGFI
ncbi:MAG: radical SAM protein [Termitinemataceae bacterium]|nr:MAG: radical SAM protein [Termitinemataceae bacterium]